MNLSIVILSYNTPDLIKNCIDSIKKQYNPEIDKNEIEIIVVDNASKSENVEILSKYFDKNKKITFIKNSENLGFGRGCNLGEKAAKGKYVLFLNSDTEVNDKGFLEMTKYLGENPKIAILGGRLNNPDGSMQSSVGHFYNLVNFIIMLVGGERAGLLRKSPDEISKVDWVSGACMMVNRELFEKIGGFDRNIFMYMEDMEICYRAKKMGYGVFFYPNVAVTHKELGSSNRTFAVVNIYSGIRYFYKKHKTLPEYYIVSGLLFIKAMGVYFLGKLTNNSYYIRTYGEALKNFR